MGHKISIKVFGRGRSQIRSAPDLTILLSGLFFDVLWEYPEPVEEQKDEGSN